MAGRTENGILQVYLGPVVQAALIIEIDILGETQTEFDRQTEANFISALPFGKIFVSYSHKDKIIVNHFLQYARALGGDYIQDVNSLRAGENWNKTLKMKINEADAFQLFWSRNSMRSSFVKNEWEYALSLQRERFIYPSYWEDPMPRDEEKGLPPAQLDQMHFYKFVSPPRIFLYVYNLQNAWKAFKGLSILSMLLFIFLTLSIMTVAFYSVKLLIRVSESRPPTSVAIPLIPSLTQVPPLNINTAPSPIQFWGNIHLEIILKL